MNTGFGHNELVRVIGRSGSTFAGQTGRVIDCEGMTRFNNMTMVRLGKSKAYLLNQNLISIEDESQPNDFGENISSNAKGN